MKKINLLYLLVILFCSSRSTAQVYTTAAGLQSDFANRYAFMIGPTIKHLFGKFNAIEGELLFGDGVAVQAFYQVQTEVAANTGLQFYVGGGPSLTFNSGGGTKFYLRPTSGFDYKPNKVPLSITFDWRPFFSPGNNGFISKRFGIGIKYAAK